MALIEAILEIVQDMENDSKDDSMKSNFCGQLLSSYAKQIRRVVKAAENEQQRFVPEKPTWEQDARNEFRKKNKEIREKVEMEDSFSGQQVEIADGPLGSTDSIPNLWSVPSGGKPGCKAVIDNSFVYRLGEDGKLYFLEEDTKLLSGEKSSIILGS